MEKINFENKPSTNSPINATNLNLLQDNVENAINEIINSQNLLSNGYIRFDNGFQIAWVTNTIDGEETVWNGIHYKEKYMGNWPVPFVTIFGAYSNQNGDGWTGIRNYSTTNVGNIRAFRPNTVGTPIITAIGFGTWK